LDSYKTIAGDGRSEVLIKGSRFIGWARPAEDADQALGAVQEARDSRPQANHHPFAYRLRGAQGRILYRSSDDGEPGGTAGRPILAVLDSRELYDAVVVVSRIFGGVKLGTGGLARAYGRAAREAVEASGIIEKSILRRCRLVIPLEILGVVEALLHRSGHKAASRGMEPPFAVLVLELTAESAVGLRSSLADATGGRVRLEPAD
jgi:putative IMPACT (imprinted ancient) family translation regulator